MTDKSREITFLDEQGNEVKAEVILTYHSDEFNHDYVVFCVYGEETASACIFHETKGDEGELEPITDEREWQMLEDVLASYYEDATFEEEGGCSGCESCDGNCDCGDDSNGNACSGNCNCRK